MLKRRCGELAEQRPGFQAASFTPHGFRRLLAIDLVNGGLVDLTLTFLRQKREQTQRLTRIAPIDLGIPGLRPAASP